MHFVHRHRLLEPRPLALARLHPAAVTPLVIGLDHDRRIEWRQLERETEWIRLQEDLAVLGQELELVLLPRFDTGDENLPHAERELAHRVAAPVPAVGVGDDADAPGVWGPDREVGSAGPANRH